MNIRFILRIVLLLVMLLLVFRGPTRRFFGAPAGIYVASPADFPDLRCGDPVLTVSNSLFAKINYQTVPLGSLANRLKDIYSERYKHVLLVRAASGLTFQEVAGVVDAARGAVPDIKIILVTPKAEQHTLCLRRDGQDKVG